MHVRCAQHVVEATAVIRIGAAPTAIAIRARERASYTQDCVGPGRLASCAQMPPTCTRR
jgi:hypothetical protein